VQGDDTEAIQRNGTDAGRKKVHVWAWRNQDGGVFFEVSASRSQEAPRSMLIGRTGMLQCDGHDCFSGLSEAITRVGCWAHVRRRFVDALKGGDELARKPLEWLRKIFDLEREAREQRIRDPVALRAFRQEKIRPLVDALKAWLDLMRIEQVGLPKSPLMDGVGYALNQWSTLTPFLEDGRIRDITNNGCERALRAVVLGRKNWLWFGSEEGAKNSTILMSLVQSCKELGINPLVYLRDVLRAVSQTPASRVRELTPLGWKRATENRLDRLRSEHLSHAAIGAVVSRLSFGR